MSNPIFSKAKQCVHTYLQLEHGIWISNITYIVLKREGSLLLMIFHAFILRQESISPIVLPLIGDGKETRNVSKVHGCPRLVP